MNISVVSGTIDKKIPLFYQIQVNQLCHEIKS